MNDFFSRIKKYVFLSGYIFIFFALAGYSASTKDSLISEKIIADIIPLTDFINSLKDWQIFIFIFLNNSIKVFISIISGIAFGIFPALFLVINGFLLGVIFYSYGAITLIGVLPHGIFELAGVFLGSGMGLYLGHMAFLGKKRKVKLEGELMASCKLFLSIILPLLLLGAIIETYFTPLLLKYFLP
ncbi:MAG: stage II sporulation protein M [Candidatus Nealsonbacteria bacterium]|nr:stage II sporulation protein M [Candidatus Nealsonbacteria bacterium]